MFLVYGLLLVSVVGVIGHGHVKIDLQTIPTKGQQPHDYGILMDAGSTGTRLYLYTWPVRAPSTIPSVTEIEVKQTLKSKVKPGISSFVNNTAGIAANLQPLIDAADAELVGKQPGGVALYLKATGGMRLLPTVDQEKVMTAVTDYLKTTPFNFISAKIISGSEEGLYGWLSVNYLSGNMKSGLKPPPTDLIGALDMGGATTQITFVPAEGDVKEHKQTVDLGDGIVYNPYAYSFLGYGRDGALRLHASNLIKSANSPGSTVYIKDPCLPNGRNTSLPDSTHNNQNFQGTGLIDECATALSKIFGSNSNCPVTPCSFDDVYSPDVKNKRFIAFNGFYYPVGFFKLDGSSLTPQGLMDYAKANYFGKTWTELQAASPNLEADFLQGYGFDSVYYTSLQQKYGFQLTTPNITWTQQVHPFYDQNETVDLGWTLGAMLAEASIYVKPPLPPIPPTPPPPPPTPPTPPTPDSGATTSTSSSVVFLIVLLASFAL